MGTPYRQCDDITLIDVVVICSAGAGGSASYPDSFPVEVMSRRFTGSRARSAQWEVDTNPKELTMAPRVLYQRLYHQLRACGPQLGVWSVQRLALLVTGVLLARHSALPRIAAQLRE